MNESMSQVLKHLGVPFFGTHAALILPDHDGNEGGKEKVVDVQGERPKWSPRVTCKELMELKRKMVGYLEDMYKNWPVGDREISVEVKIAKTEDRTLESL